MSIWHLRSARRSTGGLSRRFRKKMRRDRGSAFLETGIGKPKKNIDRVSGGNVKIRLLKIDKANVLDPKTRKVKSVAIKTVKQNPANPHYVRRNVITRGAIIETELGLARVTSRPGQHGVVNALLVEEKKG